MNIFNKRVNRLRILMTKAGLDAILTPSVNNVFYYTGLEMLSGDSAFLLISKLGNIDLFISPLVNYARLKTAKIHTIDIKELKNLLGKYRKVGYDEFGFTVHAFRKLKTKGVKFFPTGDMMREPRGIKDTGEVNNIKKALNITESTIRNLKPAGKTESQLAKEVECGFLKRGALSAFETIVSSGKRSFFIHYKAQDKMIAKKDIMLVDCGARVNNYCGDMTRMFCNKPNAKQKIILEDVIDIQEKLIDYIKEGVVFKNINNYYRKLLDKKRYQMFHSFGHGLGLGVHEGPFNGEIKAGMVLTVEPGIYIKGFGGCRIEDVILVKKDKAKPLSGMSRSYVSF